MRAPHRHLLLPALGGALALLFAAAPVAAQSAPAASTAPTFSEDELRLLYEEAAAIGAHTYTFYILASREADVIEDVGRQLSQPRNQAQSLKSLMKLQANRIDAFAIPTPVREQLRRLGPGGRSPGFRLDKDSWAIVELESVQEKPIAGYGTLRAVLPALVSKGALPAPTALQSEPLLVNRRLMNTVRSAQDFDRLPPGFDVDQPLSNGYLLLQQALLREDQELLKAVLKRLANPNLCAMYRCPLQIALESKQHAADFVRQLLAAGAQPDQTAGPGQDTALTLASLNGRRDIVELLLAAGADLNGGSGGRTPLAVAVYRDHFEIAQLLLDRGADPLYSKPATGTRFTPAPPISVVLGGGRPQAAALLRAAVMKKVAAQPQYRWDGWLEQDGQKYPLADGTLRLKRAPFTLNVHLGPEATLRLASSTSTRVFDELRTSDLGAPVYELGKTAREPHTGSAEWLLVSDDRKIAASERRPGGLQAWTTHLHTPDFNRIEDTPQGRLYVRTVSQLALNDGKQDVRPVPIADTDIAEINMAIGTAVDYDARSGDYANLQKIKLVFDR